MDEFTEQSSDVVVVLAAGNGTRLKSSIPKVLHKIGGLAMVDHVIKSAKAIDPKAIVVVLNPAHEIATKEDAPMFAYYNEVLKAYQKIPTGSGDAVRCALNVLNHANKKKDGSVAIDCNQANNANDWVYVLYADVPLVSPNVLRALKKVALTYPETALVALVMSAKGNQCLGRLEAAPEIGTIRSIVEAKDARDCEKQRTESKMIGDDAQSQNFLDLCNCGLLIRRDVLSEMIRKIRPSPVTGEFYITEIVRLIYDAGFVCRYYEGPVDELSGANTMEELCVLEQHFQQQMRRKHTENGVRLVAPETVFFSHDTKIEPDVVVSPYVIFMDGVSIKSGSFIDSFCTLQGTSINCSSIGPFARLRPGTEVHDNASIGNFVEIKNSIISEKSKINHLSYVGDSFVGMETNIGAGSVTCNYDGFTKYKTTIGNNVFIGSNSSIVAPVQVGNDAMVAAGSVVTHNVQDGDMVFARARQKNIEKGAIIFRNKKRRSKI
ncbi:MAG: NTP transferase domain-containing protein [Holosporaceae bacterium]|jgi:bifunctional UDP-N-acetylglucosamine pyrophosphorylase/glucosamine-1-phosphate N-acetyltransferase|nr:NTP transferase domain-containing protein [Holosporaceae bacterium]